MKIQNILLTVIVLILLNILFYNISMLSYKMERPNSVAESNGKTIVQLVEKILEMNAEILTLQSKYPTDLSISDLTQLLLESGRESLATQGELRLYIEKLQAELNHKKELPFSAAIPGGSGNNVFLEYPLIAATNTEEAMNYGFVDEIDEAYFSGTNQYKGSQIIEKDSKINKDLAEFNRYVSYVNPTVLTSQKEQTKGRAYVSAETLLNTSSYHSKEQLKTHLKVEKLTKELKGYCINLFTRDEMLPSNHPIFENYGGLMMEEVSTNEYRYFIGSFATRNGASNHLEKVLQSKFPNAEVVYYKKGNRRGNLWQFFFGPLGRQIEW